MDADPATFDIHFAFYTLLRNYGLLSEQLKTALLSAACYFSHPVKSHLLKSGQIASKMWFLYSGYVRWYKDDEEHPATVWLSVPRSMIIVPQSFLQEAPSSYHLQALIACRTLSFNYSDVAQIAQEHPSFRAMIAKIADTHTAEMYAYAETMRLDKGEERMKYLRQLVGSDIYGLPVEALSSFINMSESTFFKLRKKTGE